MSALDDARRLMAMRAHRKTIIKNLAEMLVPLRVAQHNENAKAVFGTETDPDVVEVLSGVESDLRWCIARLERYNAEEAS